VPPAIADFLSTGHEKCAHHRWQRRDAEAARPRAEKAAEFTRTTECLSSSAGALSSALQLGRTDPQTQMRVINKEKFHETGAFD